MSTTIHVQQVINSPFGVDASDGEKIYELLHKAISRKEQVNLSFKGIDLVITAFLNAAIGKLYKDYNTEEIEKYIKRTDFPEVFEYSWVKVVEGAPIYYKNKELFDQISENQEDEQV